MGAKVDLSALSKIKLTSILNSTVLGDFVKAGTIISFMERGGDFKVGSKYDLLRCISWMFVHEKTYVKKKNKTYEDVKEEARKRSEAKSLSGREIGKVPEVVHPGRRESCKYNFKLFCETYFPQIFTLPWSPDHLDVIERIQSSVLKGGLFALAMPRGFGKSTLVEIAGIWALMYGHRKFIVMVGSDEGHAVDMLFSIKSEFEHNDRLNEDFPEICHPIRALEGNSQRTSGQLCNGERTEISWKTKEIILPTVIGSMASGSIIKTAGITARIRGMKHKLVSGEVLRPDFSIIDDPQTDESANSLSQNEFRIRVVSGTILGLVGPGMKMAGFMPCTVIADGDMADVMLDQDLHADWNGFRTQMLKNFEPEEKDCKYNMKMWDEYNEIRKESLKIRHDISLATEFYKENQTEMDLGSVVSWPENFNEDEISGLQHAMNLYYRNPEAFFSEGQNAPRVKQVGDTQLMRKGDIAKKVNMYRRNEVPENCDLVTAMVDVQKKVLFYTVIAWEANGTGYIIDYGTFPDQKQSYFSKSKIKISYNAVKINGGYEARLHLALKNVVKILCGKTYYRADTMEIKIELMLIDANWAESTETIYNFCRMSEYSRQLRPSHGRGFGAGTLPMAEYRKQRGDIIGSHWRMAHPKGKRVIRSVLFDTNFWKSWIHERLRVAMGGNGCLSLYGKKPEEHLMFSEHLTAEYVILTEGRGRKVTEFKEYPSRPDNDFLDCVVGCAVAAAIKGIKLMGATDIMTKTKKRTRKMSEILAEKRRGK